MIQFSEVTKSFGLQTVLNNLSYRLKQGECLVITGSSGVGKTTLISLLIGAEKPDGGQILIDNIRVEDLSDSEMQMYRRRIGVVFQDFKLLKKKTVFENTAFALEACEIEEESIERKVGEILQRVGLSAMAHKFPHQLSGGERQRTAIARALVHSPKLLVADEPTGNLDPENTREIARLLKKLHQEDGLTLLITTHDPIFLEEIAPCRVVQLEQGIFHKKS